MTAALQSPAVSCPKCGGQVWDNRKDKKNPKAPDFKCRDKNCDGVIWPPKPAKAAPKPVSQGHPEFLANQEAEDAAELAGKIGPPEKPKLTKLYLDATEFVLDKVVPKFEEKEIGLTDTAVAAMIATVFIAASKER